MSYERDPRVDEYIARLQESQHDICQRLRDLIHAADPEVTTTRQPGQSPCAEKMRSTPRR